MLAWKPSPAVANTDVQDEDEIANSVDDDEVTPTEDKLENLFQDTPLEEELETEWFKFNLQTLQKKPSSLWEPANILEIHINDKKICKFLS